MWMLVTSSAHGPILACGPASRVRSCQPCARNFILRIGELSAYKFKPDGNEPQYRVAGGGLRAEGQGAESIVVGLCSMV